MKRFMFLVMPLTLSLVLGSGFGATFAENIDPDDDGSQYAYGENIGWLNFKPSLGPGVTVTDDMVTGFVWAENIGWVNLSPAAHGGVVNDGEGNLSGHAWGENVGWINFAPASGGGVFIDEAGNLDGWAWGENIGWIHFQNAALSYKVKTAWAPPQPSIPGDLDDDGDVDGDDRNLLRAALTSCTGDSSFFPESDYDENGCITYNDYRLWYTLYRQFIAP